MVSSGGGGIGIGGGGFIPAGRAIVQAQLAAAAQAAAQREAALRRRAESDQKVLQVAQQAESEGDLSAASRLYQRLALRRPANATTKPAQDRLLKIQGDALAKLQTIEDQLKEVKRPAATAFSPVELDADKVTKLFEELDALLLEYAGVASVESRIEDRLKHLRNDGKYAAVLQEPTAAELWKMGQDYEKQQQVCCAMLVYEQAVSLSPAPSAKLARARMATLNKDPSVKLAVDHCRILQLCHDKFREAEKLKASKPEQAREHLARIIELAPADTSIHRAARDQLAMLR